MSDETKSKATDKPATANFAESPEYLALKAELDAARATNAETAAKLAETSAAFSATQAQFSATQAALEAARIKQVATDAAAFALSEIRAGRSTANEYTDLIADFSEAAELDHKLGEQVTFSDAKGEAVKGSRVDKLRARESRRKSHGLFEPGLGDGVLLNDGEKILFNDKASEGEASIRAAADAVLAKTNEGRAVLARRGK